MLTAARKNPQPNFPGPPNAQVQLRTSPSAQLDDTIGTVAASLISNSLVRQLQRLVRRRALPVRTTELVRSCVKGSPSIGTAILLTEERLGTPDCCAHRVPTTVVEDSRGGLEGHSSVILDERPVVLIAVC